MLGSDGKIVFVPGHADNIGIFDPSDRSFTTIDISDKISIDYKYVGGVLGPDGKIVFVPRTANNIGILELGNKDLAYEVSPQVITAYTFSGRTHVPGTTTSSVPSVREGLVNDRYHHEWIVYQNGRWENGNYEMVHWWIAGPPGTWPPSGMWTRADDWNMSDREGKRVPDDTEKWSALLSPHFNKF